jgi:hypothetical protein
MLERQAAAATEEAVLGAPSVRFFAVGQRDVSTSGDVNSDFEGRVSNPPPVFVNSV